MTTGAQGGSTEQNGGQAAQGTSMSGQQGGNQNGSQPNAALGEMFKGVKDTTLKFITDNGFDKAESPIAFLDGVAESYQGLVSKMGQQFTVPKADASDEDWNKFTSMLRAEKADDYKFTLPKDLPQNFPYEKESAQAFQQFAFDSGIHPKHAAMMHDWFVQAAAKNFTSAVEAINTRVKDSHAALTKEWGHTDSPSYRENVEAGRRAIQNLGGNDLVTELKSFGMITDNDMIVAPVLAKALATVGAVLYKEERQVPSSGSQTSGQHEGGGGTQSGNPFKRETEHLGKQAELVKSNPDLAKRLIREAGFDPKEWQL